MPLRVGEKDTEIEQLAPDMRDAPQVFVWLKKLGETEIAVRDNVPRPEFFSVSVLALLEVPTTCKPKFKAREDRIPFPFEIPVPWRVATSGVALPLTTMLTVPVRSPVAIGLNATSTPPHP